MSAAVSNTGNGGMKRSADQSNLNSTNSLNGDAAGAGADSTAASMSPPPPEKRSYIVVESPVKLDKISSAEDLDIKVLRIQNKNLSERLIQRQKLEYELREKINQLQNRKAEDDQKIYLIDRYWTQLDEDMRLILDRFDSTSTENSSCSGESDKMSGQTVRKFLSKLNDWDKEEIDLLLVERVKFTNQTVAKLVENYDRLVTKKDLYYRELASQGFKNSLFFCL
jgi:E3 ubiquitin-protein ligase BRE1